LTTDIQVLTTDIQVMITDIQVIITDIQVMITDIQVIITDIQVMITYIQVMTTDKMLFFSMYFGFNRKHSSAVGIYRSNQLELDTNREGRPPMRPQPQLLHTSS